MDNEKRTRPIGTRVTSLSESEGGPAPILRAPRKGVVRDVRPLIPGDRRLITKHWEDIAREWTCDNITRGLHDSGRQGTEGIRFRPFLMKT